MVARFRIACIRKPDRYSPIEHITDVGGDGGGGWTLPVESVIGRIESGQEGFFVRVGNAETDVIVVPASLSKRKHIKTKPDATQRDNLLSLPECP
jgi:hypothetical protein